VQRVEGGLDFHPDVGQEVPARPISTTINNVKNQGPECVAERKD